MKIIKKILKFTFNILIFFIFSFFIFNLFSTPIYAYPDTFLIYPEKIKKPIPSFPYNYIFDNNIQYTYSIVNKNEDNRSKFIGSTLATFFDIYFVNKKIKLSEIEKNQLISFVFNNLAIFFQTQRTINNQFNLNSKFFEEIYSKDFKLIPIKESNSDDKEKGNDKSLINFEIIYEYDIKNSLITIVCRKTYLFNQQLNEFSLSFNYNYITFYNDFKNLFINKIMSFFLNTKFHYLNIELTSSAFIEVDGTVLGHFEDEKYPSVFEIILEEGEHEILFFEDGYNSIKQRIELKEDILISISLSKKIAHCNLIINTFPVGAKIKVGNTFIGVSPINIELPSGKHFIVISNNGYESKEVFIEIKDNEFEKKLYVYLMPVNTTSFYIDYSNKILNQVYQYFWNGCFGIAGAILGSIMYNYFNQFSNSSFYEIQYFGIYGSLGLIAAGIITFAIFEIMSLSELWKYYHYINYYTI